MLRATSRESLPWLARRIRFARSTVEGELSRLCSFFKAEGRTFVLVTLQSLHPQRELLTDIRMSFFWIIPIALLLAALGGYFLARKSLAPVALMASKARTIGAANLHDRLGVWNESTR